MFMLSAIHSQLLLVDVQEKLAPAVVDAEAITARCAFVLACARQLGVPFTVSEQYPKGLGPTVASLMEAVGNAPRLPKVAFSALGDAALADRIGGLRGEGRGQLVLIGIEAHVCVLQTAFDARRAGYDVFVVADAASSRTVRDRDAGFARMAAGGISVVTAEMVMFEWLEKAGTADFKSLSQMIR